MIKTRILPLFYLVFCLSFVVVIQAQTQTFKVPGEAGRGWIDTKIDVFPGMQIYIGAEGEVYYGDGIGVFGPEGTAKLGRAIGFPAETEYRYGLTARITGSRQNPEDDLREDFPYGRQKDLCARSRGRLWLTANDDQASDNKGEYIVHIKIGKCDAEPPLLASPPTTDAGRGTFRVKIIGFRVERVVHDGVFDAGDDAFVVWDAAELNADGRFSNRSPLGGQSLIYGDANRRRARVRAGTQGAGGGLKNGDEVVADQWANPSAERFPMTVGDFELVDGANAVVFVPTVWVAKNNPGDLLERYRGRIQSAFRFASHDTRALIENRSAQLQMLSSSTRSQNDWFDWSVPLFMGTDHPVGLSGTATGIQRVSGDYPLGSYVPNAYALTYRSVTNLLHTGGANVNRNPVRFEANYTGSGIPGSYRLLMTVERVR